ncbi:hypothetical protein Tco_0398463 [Tanacetum coccineum]
MANFATKYSIMTQEMVVFAIAFIFRLGFIPLLQGVDSVYKFFYGRSQVLPSAYLPTVALWCGLVPLYTGGALEKDPAPHLTARQEQTVKLLESHKVLFHWYPECFLCLVGLSPYYPFDENSYPDFEYPGRSYMSLFDFIKNADPRKVQAVEVQKGDNQVKLLESTKHCFMSLEVPAAGGSVSAAVAEAFVPTEEGHEDVAPEDAYMELADPDEGTVAMRQSREDIVTEQPKKFKKKRLMKQSDVLPAKKLRLYHPTLASSTGGKTLAGLEQIMPAGSHLLDREHLALSSAAPSSQESEGFLDSSAQTNLLIRTTVESSSTLGIPVGTTAATTTSTRAVATTEFATDINPDLAGPSQPAESEGSDDSFYESLTLDLSVTKHWYVPKWNITNDLLLDDGFSCRTLVDRVAPPAFFSALRTMDYDQLYTEFNIGAMRQVCLGAEVRSHAEHELELKEKLKAKYTARGRWLEEKDLEILKLKSQLTKKEVEAAEVICLRDQVSSLSGEKSALIAEVSALEVIVAQKDNDISLLNSRATYLTSTLDDAKVACAEAENKIISLASERDKLASEVSSLRTSFQDFKEKMEIQQVKQAQELYNRVAELEEHVMDVSSHLEEEFYLAYLTTLAGRRWLLTHGIQLTLLKYLKSPVYQGILGHALGRAVDFGMQEGLAAGHKHGTAGRDLFALRLTTRRSKKDAGMDEVLDCFLLDGPLAGLPEAAYLQPCLEQLSIPIHHAGDKTVVGETSCPLR